jgi:hypothetical protein
MARLANPPKKGLRHIVLPKDQTRQALEWLQENPSQRPTAAARIFHIDNEEALLQKWRRARKRIIRTGTMEPVQRGGQNKILRPE